jgi:hypothetical protein
MTSCFDVIGCSIAFHTAQSSLKQNKYMLTVKVGIGFLSTTIHKMVAQMDSSAMSLQIHDDDAILPSTDLEKGLDLSPTPPLKDEAKEVPPLKALSLLDRFLVVWIILAMAIGILLGNFVPSTGPALQRGEFVGVSIPIGMSSLLHTFSV